MSFGLLAEQRRRRRRGDEVMSLTTFAGSAQFAAVAALKEGGGGLLAGIVAAVFLNLRYLPIGLSVAEAVPGLVVAAAAAGPAGGRRVLGPRPGRAGPLGRRPAARRRARPVRAPGTSARSSEASAGQVIGDPARLGLDAAFPALFAALLAGQLRDGAGGLAPVRRMRIVAAAGALIALVALPIAPNGLPIVVAALAVFIPVRWTDAMSDAWILVVVVGLATVAIKGAGPVLLGSRELPPGSPRRSRCWRRRCWRPWWW